MWACADIGGWTWARCAWNAGSATSSTATSMVAAPPMTTRPIAAKSRSVRPRPGRCGWRVDAWAFTRASPGTHPVADTTNGHDESRGGGVVPELAPDVGDVNVDEVLVTHPVRAPDP